MGNVVELQENPIAKARAIKNRLWNPQNGHQSSELDVVSTSEMNKRRARELSQREQIKAEA